MTSKGRLQDLHLQRYILFSHPARIAPNNKTPTSKLQALSQLSLPCQIPRIVNRMLHRLLGHTPQPLPHLLCLRTPLLQLRVRPLKVEGQIKIRVILALRNSIIDKCAAVEVVEVDLSMHTNQFACMEDNSQARREREVPSTACVSANPQ